MISYSDTSESITVRPQYTPAKRRPRWLPPFWRTVQEPLIPLAYFQIPVPTTAATALRWQDIPTRASLLVVNVEGAAVRYCDAGTPTSTYGELYQAGSSFSRAVDPRLVMFCGVGSGSIVNVSLYGIPD